MEQKSFQQNKPSNKKNVITINNNTEQSNKSKVHIVIQGLCKSIKNIVVSIQAYFRGKRTLRNILVTP